MAVWSDSTRWGGTMGGSWGTGRVEEVEEREITFEAGLPFDEDAK